MKFKINPFLVGYLALVCFVFHATDVLTRGPGGQGGRRACCSRLPAVTYASRPAGHDCPEGEAGSSGEIQRAVVDTYVEVRSSEGQGSGTVVKVGEEVLILTAAHVVGGWDKTVRVSPRGEGVSQDAQVVKISPPDENGGTDLALLRPSAPEALGAVPAVITNPGGLDPGEDAWYCGSGGGIPANLNRTIINRAGLKGGGRSWFLVNGNGYYGHSGSGVFVRREGGLVLVGVVLRIWPTYPKTPVFCREPQDVRAFVDEYLEGQK